MAYLINGNNIFITNYIQIVAPNAPISITGSTSIRSNSSQKTMFVLASLNINTVNGIVMVYTYPSSPIVPLPSP